MEYFCTKTIVVFLKDGHQHQCLKLGGKCGSSVGCTQGHLRQPVGLQLQHLEELIQVLPLGPEGVGREPQQQMVALVSLSVGCTRLWVKLLF